MIVLEMKCPQLSKPEATAAGGRVASIGWQRFSQRVTTTLLTGVHLNFRTWMQGLVKGVQSEREERKNTEWDTRERNQNNEKKLEN